MPVSQSKKCHTFPPNQNSVHAKRFASLFEHKSTIQPKFGLAQTNNAIMSRIRKMIQKFETGCEYALSIVDTELLAETYAVHV